MSVGDRDSNQGRVRAMTRGDLETVLSWRNQPAIRASMFTQHEIGMAEHAAWFERASQDAGKCLLIYEEGATPLGFVNFSGVAPGATVLWGFYTAPDAPKGTGRRLGRAALDFVFGTLHVRKVRGEVLDANEPSLRFHRALHFSEEGVQRAAQRINGVDHDVVCFGLMDDDWRAHSGDK